MKFVHIILQRFPQLRRWSNYLLEQLSSLRMKLGRKKPDYVGRHRSDPVHETQYAHDPVSTGTIVAIPRARRSPIALLRSFRHPSSAKEPALRRVRYASGRVSRAQVDLIATLTIAMQLVADEQFIKRLPASRALPMYPSHP